MTLAPQSMFDTANDRADEIAGLGWWALLGFLLVSLAMWALLAWAARRRRGSFDEHMPATLQDGKGWIVFGGIILPGLTFLGFLVFSLVRMHSAAPVVHDHHRGHAAADIRVIGHRWWWEVQYLSVEPGDIVTSANEIHIPAGQPVTLELQSADVIHSFWVPALHGKVDLIPQYKNLLTIQANTPGVYRGQCAEYCGTQHANMKLLVVAHPPAEYDRWRTAEWTPAAAPTTPDAIRGKQVFEAKACSGCHAIRGTRALGHVGPDLTHFASRIGLAANMLPRDRAYLTAWVTRPHSLKPGVVMPDLGAMTGEEITALVTYLMVLQ